MTSRELTVMDDDLSDQEVDAIFTAYDQSKAELDQFSRYGKAMAVLDNDLDQHEHYELPDTIDNGRDYDATEGASSNPALAKYSPPGDLAKQMGPADWQIFDAIRPAAHKLGVTPKQFAGLTKAVLAIQVDQVDRANDKAVAVLQKRFGTDFRQAMLDADAAAAEYGDSGLSAWLDTPVPGFPGLRFATIPHIAVLLASVGRAMRGGSTAYQPLARNTETSGGQSMSQQKALAAIKVLKEERMDHSMGTPKYRELSAKLTRLFQIAYPDDAEEDQTRNGLGPLNRR